MCRSPVFPEHGFSPLKILTRCVQIRNVNNSKIAVITTVMSDSNFYDIRLTDRQMINYCKAVHCLLNLSEKEYFYEGIRDAFPEYRGSNETLKREIIDPIIDSLGKIRLSEKGDKNTHFNQSISVTSVIQEMIDQLASENYNISEYYVDEKENITNGYKVQNIIKDYLKINRCFRNERWTIPESMRDEMSGLVADMRQEKKMNNDNTIDSSNSYVGAIVQELEIDSVLRGPALGHPRAGAIDG